MIRKIVICCDGKWTTTSSEKDQQKALPTNVEKIFKLIDQKNDLKTYYDSGINTSGVLGKLKGQDLLESIKQAYTFLVRNYTSGAEIYLFGFSRGATIARCLSGMIRKCGLLKDTELDEQLDNAIKLYRNTELDRNSMEAQMFRTKYTVMPKDSIELIANGQKKKRLMYNIKIKMLGVWETVGTLGVPQSGITGITKEKYQFHDTILSPDVLNGFQALAIDEVRSTFKPCIWTMNSYLKKQNIEQRWFAGTHANIGGGYTDNGLSDISLRWMMDKAKTLGLPLLPSFKKVKGDFHGKQQKLTLKLYKNIKRYERPLMHNDYINMMIDDSVSKRFQENSLKYYPNNLLYELRKKDPTFIIAKEQFNFTGKYIEAGKKYKFSVDGLWQDNGYQSDALGFDKFHIKPLRFRNGKVFSLIGTIGRDDSTAFDIGEIIESHSTFTAEKSGMLYCYANDSRNDYNDNTGYIKVDIRSAH